MKELRHAMIDLETMGTKPDSAIVSIGVVIFDPRLNKIGDKLYLELDWKNQDRVIDPGTKEWWKGNSKEAKKALHGTLSLEDALEEVAFFLPSDCKVWGNGATFDISMLENAYDQLDIEVPWKFWNIRDCRTINDLYEALRGGFNKATGGTLHNALDDAYYQVQYINMMWYKISNPKT